MLMKNGSPHRRSQTVWAAVWLLVLGLAAGCATAPPPSADDRTAAQTQWEADIAGYEREAREHPDDKVLALKLQLFKQQAAYVHVKQGEQLLNQQRTEEALAEFQRALQLDPTLDIAKARVRQLQPQLPTPAPAAPPETALMGKSLSIAPAPEPVAPAAASKSPPPPDSGSGAGQGGMSAISSAAGGATAPTATDQTASASIPVPSTGSTPVVMVQPLQSTAQVGQQLTVQVNVANAINLFGAPFYLAYDPSRLDVVGAAEGGFLKSDGQSTVFLNSIDAQRGQIIIGLSRLGSVGGVSGSGNLAAITFRAKATGAVTFTLQNVDFRDPGLVQIPVLLQPANVQIVGG
jgi:hypothetical protein